MNDQSLEALRAQRDELSERIHELERTELEELKARAASFGLTLSREPPKKERRKRRTKEELELARNGLDA